MGHPKKSLCQCWGACPHALTYQRLWVALFATDCWDPHLGTKKPKSQMFVVTVPCFKHLWGQWPKLCRLGTLQRSLGSVPRNLKLTTAQPMCHHLLINWTVLWSLLSMMKGSSMLVAPTSPPSLEAGTHSSTCLPGVPEVMPSTTQKTYLTSLLNVYQVLGKLTYYCRPQATFIRGSMILLGDRTSPQLHSEEEGTLECRLDPKCWVVVLLQLATSGHRVLPTSWKAWSMHACSSQAISSGTAR